jgi:hypothetical protein
MRRSYIESIFYHEGLKCVVLFLEMGHRCGYVGIGKNHPLFGVDYSQDIKSPELLQELNSTDIGKRGIIDVFCWDGEKTTPSILFNVHGGVTYSGGEARYPILQVFNDLWWFGFDCAHCDDAKDWVTLKRRVERHKWEAMWSIEQKFPFRNDMRIVRNREYVEDECRRLAESLSCVGDLLKETRVLIG